MAPQGLVVLQGQVDLLGLEDLLAQGAHQELLELEDPREQGAHPAQVALLVQAVHEELVVQPAQVALLGLGDPQEPVVHLGQEVPQDSVVHLELVVLPALVAHQEYEGQVARPGLVALKEKLEQQDLQVKQYNTSI